MNAAPFKISKLFLSAGPIPQVSATRLAISLNSDEIRVQDGSCVRLRRDGVFGWDGEAEALYLLCDVTCDLTLSSKPLQVVANGCYKVQLK